MATTDQMILSDCCHARAATELAGKLEGLDPEDPKSDTYYGCTKCGNPCTVYRPAAIIFTVEEKKKDEQD